MKLLTAAAAFVVVSAAASSGFSSQQEADVPVPQAISSDRSAEICFDPADEMADGVPVLALHTVATKGDGWVAIEVTSVLTQEQTVIGLFPSDSFSSASTNDVRRFFLPPDAGNCFSIRIIGNGEATGEVTLERSEL